MGNPMSGVMSRYLEFLRKYAFVLFVLLVVLCYGGIQSIRSLEIETDWSRLFPYPEDADSITLLSRINTMLGATFIFESETDEPVNSRISALDEIVHLIDASDLFGPLFYKYESVSQLSVMPEVSAVFLTAADSETLARNLTPDAIAAQVRENVRLLFSPAGSLVRRMIIQDPFQLNTKALANLQLRVGYHINDGYMISDDHRRLVVIGIPPTNDTQMQKDWLDRLVVLMRELREKAHQHHIRCRMPGGMFLRAELLESVRHDLVKTIVLSLCLVMGLFLFMYRKSIKAIICILFPLACAILLTFTVYAWFNSSIDMITAMSAAMLIGLGVDFGIHLLSRYASTEGSIVSRLHMALRGTGRGVISSALTTSIAFFSILVTGMKSFYMLGITAGIGILLCGVSFFFVFPVCVFLFKPYSSLDLRINPAPLPLGTAATTESPIVICSSRCPQRQVGATWSPKRSHAYMFLALCIIVAPFLMARLHFESDFKMFLPEESHVLKDMKAMQSGNSANETDGLVMQITSRGYPADSALLTALQQHYPDAVWRSPFSVLPSFEDYQAARERFQNVSKELGVTSESTKQTLQQAYHESGLKYDRSLDHYIDGIFGAMGSGTMGQRLYALPIVQPYFIGGEVMDRSRDVIGRTAPPTETVSLQPGGDVQFDENAVGRVSDTARVEGVSFVALAVHADGRAWSREEINGIKDIVDECDASASFMSGALMMEKVGKKAIPESILAAVVSLVLISIILWVHFRRWRYILLALVPLTFGLILMFSVMGLFHISINYFNITVIPLIFGLGIDDGIHFIQSALEYGGGREALRRVARPVCYTTLTTCLGFGSLVTVAFRGIQYMGITVIIGLCATMVITLFVLPGLCANAPGK